MAIIKRILYFIFGIPITLVAALGILGSIGDKSDTSPFMIFIFLLFLGLLFVFLGIQSGKKEVKKQYTNPYVDVTLYKNGGGFPKVNYHNVFLQPGEWIIYAVPAKTFAEKEQVVGYTGGSSGVGVRVAKGVSLSSGNSKARAVRQRVKTFNSGDYVVTNRRILFVSQTDGFEFSIKEISAIKIVSEDAFTISTGNKYKNICVNKNELTFAFSTTKLMVEESVKYDNGMPQPLYVADGTLNQPEDYDQAYSEQQVNIMVERMNQKLDELEKSVGKIEELYDENKMS